MPVQTETQQYYTILEQMIFANYTAFLKAYNYDIAGLVFCINTILNDINNQHKAAYYVLSVVKILEGSFEAFGVDWKLEQVSEDGSIRYILVTS